MLVASALAGVGVSALVGGPAGLALGVAASVGADRLLRRAAMAPTRPDPAALTADLPLALDLLAACIGAGAAPHDALDAVGHAVPGPLGDALRVVARGMALGASAQQAWVELMTAETPPALRDCAARFVTAQASGAALAPALTRLAADQRRTAAMAARTGASRAGVLAVGPLGLCFLPAFVFIGVVPMVAGLVVAMPL